MHKYRPKHHRTGTARMKLNKETEKEGKQSKENMRKPRWHGTKVPKVYPKLGPIYQQGCFPPKQWMNFLARRTLHLPTPTQVLTPIRELFHGNSNCENLPSK